jgi:hypothetical protein
MKFLTTWRVATTTDVFILIILNLRQNGSTLKETSSYTEFINKKMSDSVNKTCLPTGLI